MTRIFYVVPDFNLKIGLNQMPNCLLEPRFRYPMFFFFAHMKKTCFPLVRLRVRHHVLRRKFAQCISRSSTNIKVPLSPGNVSQHRPAFIRTIVEVPA